MNLTPAPQQGRYAVIQAMLEDAAGPSADPDNDGQGRFWRLPYDQFMKLPTIYGNPIIAASVPNRGESSGLVKVLQGTLPNVPRKPLNRPALDDVKIEFISKWIDDGCLEI